MRFAGKNRHSEIVGRVSNYLLGIEADISRRDLLSRIGCVLSDV